MLEKRPDVWRTVDEFLAFHQLTTSDLVRFYHAGGRLPVGYGGKGKKHSSPMILGGDADYDIGMLLEALGLRSKGSARS